MQIKPINVKVCSDEYIVVARFHRFSIVAIVRLCNEFLLFLLLLFFWFEFETKREIRYHQNRFISLLVLLHTGLHQIQMGSLEAVETTECPDASMIFVWIFISAFLDLWLDLSFIFALTQLLHETFHIEALVVGKQTHFFENATNVATSLFIVREVPFFVFVNGGLWDVQR